MNGGGARPAAGIDARKMGTLVDRTHRELTEEDIAKIARTSHAWRGQKEQGVYTDVAGFCRGVKREEIRQHEWVLTPGRYVGAEEAEGDGKAFEVKVERLAAELEKQFEEGRKLEGVIRQNFAGLGYGH
jgi:type I restriction enzyme M protein